VYELDQSNTLGERTLLRLVDHLIEDTYHAASGSENFADWKAQIARDVHMYVCSNRFVNPVVLRFCVCALAVGMIVGYHPCREESTRTFLIIYISQVY
jgi:hypothetical protein